MTKSDPLVIFTPSGNPIKISGMDDTLSDARAPLLDGDRQGILDWLDAQYPPAVAAIYCTSPLWRYIRGANKPQARKNHG